MDVTRWITDAPIDLDPLLDETADPSCGALVVFGGLVRNTNDGRPVSGMTYDAHASMAASTLEALEREVLERFDVARCRIVHRIGPLALEEPSVWIVVRSGHRGAAFDAAEWAIDTLKTRLPVWKREHYIDGSDRFLDGTPLNDAAHAPAGTPAANSGTSTTPSDDA